MMYNMCTMCTYIYIERERDRDICVYIYNIMCMYLSEFEVPNYTTNEHIQMFNNPW